MLAVGFVLVAADGLRPAIQGHEGSRNQRRHQPPRPQDGDQLKRVFQRNRADYEKVLREANWPGNPGGSLPGRRERTSSAKPSTRWATPSSGWPFERGESPWPRFPSDGREPRPSRRSRSASISNDREYRFLIPKACGNLALVSSARLTPIDRQAAGSRPYPSGPGPESVHGHERDRGRRCLGRQHAPGRDRRADDDEAERTERDSDRDSRGRRLPVDGQARRCRRLRLHRGHQFQRGTNP